MESKHQYVAAPSELPIALQITNFKQIDSPLADWQGRVVTDRDMPNGERGFDVIFKKLPEGWKAQTYYLGATPETLPKTWPEGCHPTPLAAVQAEMSSASTNSKIMHEFLQCFASITPVTSAEHERVQAERKVISPPKPNNENPAPLEDEKPDPKAAEPKQSEKRSSALQRTIKATIRQGEQSGYVAECLEIPVVTQGRTLDEVTRNLREAVELHLEGEDLAELGLAPSPSILVTFELEAHPATA